MAPDQADRRLRLPQRCAAFWVPDQNAPARDFLAQARSATNAATAARRTPQEGLRAPEVWVPDQNNALRFSGFRPEARLRATLGQDAPHGLGVSDPSPCAPPRQALCAGLFGQSVVGFCGTARGEWAGPVWAKNRSGRAVTCVSFPPSQRRAPFRGIHKGYSPYVCFLPCFLHKQKTSRPPGRDRASSAACGTHLKKVRCCAAAQKEPQRGADTPHPGAACGTLLKKGKVLHRCIKKATCCAAVQTEASCLSHRKALLTGKQCHGRIRRHGPPGKSIQGKGGTISFLKVRTGRQGRLPGHQTNKERSLCY